MSKAKTAEAKAAEAKGTELFEVRTGRHGNIAGTYTAQDAAIAHAKAARGDVYRFVAFATSETFKAYSAAMSAQEGCGWCGYSHVAYD